MASLDTFPGSGSASVQVTAPGPVATVTLNRPHVHNALDRETLITLVEVLRAMAGDDSVRVVVLTGADGTFCSGDDLGEAAAMTRESFLAHIECFQEVTRALREMPQPVIASIAGHAQGGGLELALGCDLRIAAADAGFACPEARWGLSITNASSLLLRRAVGETRARELVLLGTPIDATAAERYGLVSKVVPAGELSAATQLWVESLLEASPSALALNKRLLNGPVEELEAALAAEVLTVMAAFEGPDAREGLRAFQERRSPSFDALED